MSAAGATNAYLDEAFAQARATRDRAVRDFGALGAARLNWKPSPERWSVAQCLQHLIASNESYGPMLEAVAAGRPDASIYTRVPLLPRVWGALVRRAVAPDRRVRSRTVPRLEPVASDLPASIVRDFAANVDAHLARVDATRGVDHRRTIVTSPIARVVTYSLRDAVIITVTHMERHYRQAVAVTEHEAFPRGEL